MSYKPGDKYIHYTKYGGINKGVVESYKEAIVVDTENLVKYYTPAIITTRGITLRLDGSDGLIYKIESEYTYEDAKILEGFLTMIHSYKHNK